MNTYIKDHQTSTTQPIIHLKSRTDIPKTNITEEATQNIAQRNKGAEIYSKKIKKIKVDS